MSDEMNVKISNIKAEFIKTEAENVDKYSGARDGYIDAREAKILSDILSGELTKKKNAKKLAKESDDVKAIFGLTVSAPAAKTEAAEVKADAIKTENVYSQVLNAFTKARGYDKESGKYAKTLDEAYKEVKAEFTDKKKYSKEERKEYETALKALKREKNKGSIVNETAREARRSALAVDDKGNVVNEKALEYKTLGQIRDAEIEALTTTSGKVDKRAKRALRQKNTTWTRRAFNWLSGADSAGKIDDKSVRSANRAAEIREMSKKEGISLDEMKKALGEKNPLLQPFTNDEGKEFENVLVATGLITKNENGKYDVSRLSLLVGNGLGADGTYNDHDVNVESENQSIRTVISDYTYDNKAKSFHAKDIDKDQIRDLTKFLGYYDDTAHGKVVRTYQSVAKNAASGAFIGGAAAGVVEVKQHQKVEIKAGSLTETQMNDLVGSLKSQGISYVQTATGVLIEQSQLVKLIQAPIGAAIGAAAGAALGVIEGLASKGREKECFGLRFGCDITYEKLIHTIENAYSDEDLSPEQKEALKGIALIGFETEVVKDKDGNPYERYKLDADCNPIWNHCKFWDEYNNLRGNNVFNSAELRATTIKLENRTVKTEECKEEKEEPVVEIPCKDCDDEYGTKDIEIPPHAWDRKGGEKWEAIVRAKYPCMVEELEKAGIGMYDKNGAIKVMQRALATDGNGVFHSDEFKAIISGDIPKHIDFPDTIEIKVGDKTIECKYEDNEVARVSQKQLGKGNLKSGGRYGYGRKGENATCTNDCHPGLEGVGKTKAEAKADLDRQIAAQKK